MAKRTMRDYMNLMEYLDDTYSDVTLIQKFGVDSIEELVKTYTMDEIYDKMEDEKYYRGLDVGEIVGVEIDEAWALSDNIYTMTYRQCCSQDIMDIEYGHILEYLREEKAYKVLAVANTEDGLCFVIAKLKKDQIKVLFKEEFEEFKYDIMKFIYNIDTKLKANTEE